MVDTISLVTILPAQPVQNSATPDIASQVITPDLPVGTTLDGFVVNRDNSGNPVLRTSSGDVTFSSNLFLKIGTEVSLRVESTGGNITANILTINGQSPEVAQAQSTLAGEEDVIFTPQFVAATGNTQVGPNPNNTVTNNALALQLNPNQVLNKAAGALIANPVVAVGAAESFLALAQNWTSLQQIFGLLADRSTDTGLDVQQAMAAGVETNIKNSDNNGAISSISPQSITTGLLAFISALRGGDFSQWIGKANVKWLQERGATELLKKAEGEFTTLAQQFTAPQAKSWESLFFPVAVDGQLQQIRMFVKRDGNKSKQSDADSNSKNDTRFVIEMDLSKLGEMQMDGFVRRDATKLQFDMVIRSLVPLPADIQQDISQIFSDTSAITGYNGTISFQAVKTFPVNPMEEIIDTTDTITA